MLLGIITLFPEMFQILTNYGITGRSVRNGLLVIKLWNPRDFTRDKRRNVDDRPYGGGPGMLMMIQPLHDAINHAKRILKGIRGDFPKVIYLSPQGKKLNQQFICKLAHDNQTLILVCGRYQGIDERLMETVIDEEWSIGDYVLSGGELAAMVLIDTVSRMFPGVLGNKQSKMTDSFYMKNRLDCPYYTRPEVFEGMKVPSVLLSGNHSNISRWKLKQSLGNTWVKRPDLLKTKLLTEEEEELLVQFQKEYLFSLREK